MNSHDVMRDMRIKAVAERFRLFRMDPGIREGRDKNLLEKRNLISSVFIAMLIGVAYQEMIAVTRESIHASGITLGVLVLFFVFFLTSLRFFIGNQLHLLSKALIEMRGDVWFYDFIVITFQTILLAFLGGASCVEVCRVARIGFVEILIALYAVDVFWIVSQWVMGRILRRWRRDFVPWAWAILNTVLIVSLLTLRFTIDDIYSEGGLIWLGILNAAAFVVDVGLVDYHGVI